MNGSGVILNADDYAMTRGISEGILALAEAGRLSSTSAIVNTPHWRGDAKAATRLRGGFAVGLHLNLTFGAPLGAMPKLAPDRVFPSRDTLVGRALSRRIDSAEVAAEIERQLDAFEEAAGVPPDFVDGHHHAHVLPGVREPLVATLKQRYPPGEMLLRNPTDRLTSIFRRRVVAGKAAIAALLAVGFQKLAIDAGLAINQGFSGFSSFGAIPYAEEFDAFLIDLGPRPMIMCHPGFLDDELGDSDAIRLRRTEEQTVLATRPDIPDLIWRANRGADAAGLRW